MTSLVRHHHLSLSLTHTLKLTLHCFGTHAGIINTPTGLYTRLAERGLVIYPGKLTAADCFRIGSIGRLFEHDMVVRGLGVIVVGYGGCC